MVQLRVSIFIPMSTYLLLIDPTGWKLLSQAPLEWTTGNLSLNSERLFTSGIQIFDGDTTVVYSGIEDADNSPRVLFFKVHDLNGSELYTLYTGDVIDNFWWYDTEKNFDRSILEQRNDSNLFFLTNHGHTSPESDSTSIIDFKAYYFGQNASLQV